MAPSLASQAWADGCATAVFLVVTASFVELGNRVGPVLGLSPGGAGLALTIALLIALVPVCERLGGALFNPANNAFLFAIGQGTAREHAARSAAQAVGGVVGSQLARTLLPARWTRDLAGMAVGLRPGVGLLEGAAAEFVLGALLAFVVLWAGQLRSSALKLWVPLLATVVAVRAGAGYTGPSLNPAFTFAWVCAYPLQSPAEHLVVFWLAPLAAGAFGGFAFRGYAAFRAERAQQGTAAAAAPKRAARRRGGRAKAE